MSVFQDEWRECLREQYKYAIRQDDTVTLESLTAVLMGDLNFSEDELRRLKIEATMHVDDMPEDFQPDFDDFQPYPQEAQLPPPQSEIEFQPHPLECQCPQCLEMNLIPHDDEGQPITDIDELAEMALKVAHDKDDEDKPKQLSLF